LYVLRATNSTDATSVQELAASRWEERLDDTRTSTPLTIAACADDFRRRSDNRFRGLGADREADGRQRTVGTPTAAGAGPGLRPVVSERGQHVHLWQTTASAWPWSGPDEQPASAPSTGTAKTNSKTTATTPCRVLALLIA
jgi:hypothetical protein